MPGRARGVGPARPLGRPEPTCGSPGFAVRDRGNTAQLQHAGSRFIMTHGIRAAGDLGQSCSATMRTAIGLGSRRLLEARRHTLTASKPVPEDSAVEGRHLAFLTRGAPWQVQARELLARFTIVTALEVALLAIVLPQLWSLIVPRLFPALCQEGLLPSDLTLVDSASLAVLISVPGEVGNAVLGLAAIVALNTTDPSVVEWGKGVASAVVARLSQMVAVLVSVGLLWSWVIPAVLPNLVDRRIVAGTLPWSALIGLGVAAWLLLSYRDWTWKKSLVATAGGPRA